MDPDARVTPLRPAEHGVWAPRRTRAGLAKALVTSLQALRMAEPTRSPGEGLRILCYHRVANERDQLAVSRRRFRRQLELIAASGFQVVDLWSYDFAAPPRGRQLAITFDDGYSDFATDALPELERLGFPAVVFVVPEAVEGRLAFPWYRPDRHPPLLSWADMRALERATPIRFEPHTMTHPRLTDLSTDDARWQLRASKQAVEQALGRPAHLFCYPGGYYSRREVELAREEGYEAAVTCEFGLNTQPLAAHELSRTLIDHYDADWIFRARLRGTLDHPPRGRRSRFLAP